jgi:ABC-type bacteriocin/lantibiotic exporter with double-glycine peptidase domain
MWPGYIGYVPQQATIIDGSLLENILLAFDESRFEREEIRELVKRMGLKEFLDYDENLGYLVGSGGNPMSGGQKQRIAMARALVSDPRILILDEPTSSLDRESEFKMMNEIYGLRGKITTLMVAHRLSTVVMADKVILMSGGRLVDIGKFAEIESRHPNITKELKLLKPNT